jgi:hypothetical protein
MHDRHDHDRLNDAAGLAAALRALPAPAPRPDGWPRLAARLHRRQRAHRHLRWAVPAALAAGLVLALVLPANFQSIAPPTPAPAPSISAEAQLAALRARSQRLQAWVHQLDDSGAPLDGGALADAAELEDLIGLVDLQLGAADNARTQLPLWRQRVVLLQQLATLRLTQGVADTSTVSSGSPTRHTPIWID